MSSIVCVYLYVIISLLVCVLNILVVVYLYVLAT